MTLQWGYAVSTLIFLAFFLVTVTTQIRSTHYDPRCYWAVVVATTTGGGTTSDYLDRTLGLGYMNSSILGVGLLHAVRFAWRATTGEIAVDHITTRRNESVYGLTSLVSNT